jgi:hypothetical protein
MSGIELLEKYPLASKVINDWVMQQMLESFKDESVPQEFKDYMLAQGVENDKLAVMIDTQPRFLFDVFDYNNVLIQINVFKTFSYSINEGDVISGSWETRKECEKHAIASAFDVLEEKLGEDRMKIIAQNGNTGEHYDEN